MNDRLFEVGDLVEINGKRRIIRHIGKLGEGDKEAGNINTIWVVWGTKGEIEDLEFNGNIAATNSGGQLRYSHPSDFKLIEPQGVLLTIIKRFNYRMAEFNLSTPGADAGKRRDD